MNISENSKQTVLQYAPDSAQADIYRKLANDIWMNEELSVPTPITFEELEKLVEYLWNRELSGILSKNSS